MFTGLVQAVGEVRLLEGFALQIEYPGWDTPLDLGESIAINGCCLTVVTDQDGVMHFDLSEETLARTNLGDQLPGARVNLERAMRPMDRFGGHIVQGHVDAVGRLVNIRQEEGSHVFRFQVPEDRYLIDKGSIALDGISLTVVRPMDGEFEVWVIPHTLRNTHLESLQAGARINVEYDIVAKYVERLVRP